VSPMRWETDIRVRHICRMLSFSVGSGLLGAASAFVGFYCAYRYDVPLAPAEIAVASVALLAVGAAVGLARVVGRAK